MNKEDIIDYDLLWDSLMKCKRGVMWKPATKSFYLNGIENINRMHNSLVNGTWKNGKPREIQINYPKKREGLSIMFKDRIYQRSINDNILYPSTTKSFILDNCACQVGKGPDFARKRLKKHLVNYLSHHDDGYVLQIDIHGYYPSMNHNLVKETFAKYLDKDVHKMVCDVLDEQYKGEVGYYPGSQMVQIAGITALNKLDHFCKEQLHIKYYRRYMDDFLIIGSDYDEVKTWKDSIVNELTRIGFEINDKKTSIKPLSKGFTFLGFNYRITKTKKILMALNSDSIKHERKKLYRLVKLANQGVITKGKVDECYNSWKQYASKGNTNNMLRRMDNYYKELWRKEL